MLAAEHVSANMDLDTLWACGADEAEADCARRFLLDLGERAWRRPLTAEQAALITRFLDAGVEPREAAQMGVELIFQAPYFLYPRRHPRRGRPRRRTSRRLGHRRPAVLLFVGHDPG
jgi:hypothetical protein